MIRLFSLIIVLSCLQLLSAEALKVGQSVYIYTDGIYDSAIKKIQKAAKEQLKANEISWKLKGSSKSSWFTLKDSVYKELLRKDADCYVLALGTYDVWDKRKKTVLEYDENDLKSAIASVIEQLTAKNKQIVICTPHMLYEGTSISACEHMEKLAAIFNDYATQANVTVCDIYTPFEIAVSAAELAKRKRGKGICTKDGFKPNDDGEAIIMDVLGSTLGISTGSSGSLKPITLKKKDYIVLAYGQHPGIDSKKFNDAFKEKYHKQWPFESPRLASYGLAGWELGGAIADRVLAQKATYYVVLPMFSYEERWLKPFLDGTYEPKFDALIKEMKEKTTAKIYLMTWFVCNETTVKNDIVVGGTNYKLSADWAAMVKRIAKTHKCPVIDFHQRSLDIIAEKGVDGQCFAGIYKKEGDSVLMGIFTPQGIALQNEMYKELFGIDF